MGCLLTASFLLEQKRFMYIPCHSLCLDPCAICVCVFSCVYVWCGLWPCFYVDSQMDVSLWQSIKSNLILMSKLRYLVQLIRKVRAMWSFKCYWILYHFPRIHLTQPHDQVIIILILLTQAHTQRTQRKRYSHTHYNYFIFQQTKYSK